ncbi:hypothetical protein Ami103574_07650 [Aminipila butyrica]|uniref:DUF5050 domain-containing protein n=1 Tax=Aminipila butyrica TaxID=433296 RepID=A0A858BWV6_9FIRM|nr:hypothetical protein [Aminipila butyrica]QIB69204.1 hypothetical protein Ami103574_07650 [Aminipila butyrica]
MKKYICRVLIFMVTIFTMGISGLGSENVYGAQGGSVSIELPSFKVIMNGETVNNNYSQYPLIVYKDITYFPMTYSDCRYLGIESTWKGDKLGLSVDATGVTAAYNPYTSSSRNGKNYKASVPAFPIQVNGKAIDNSKEEYPLLSFRNITYFPMTWKYGVEQFGWDYSFNQKSGLAITSKNIKLKQTAISANRPEEPEYSSFVGKKDTNVVVKGGYVYFTNKTGGILQAPLTNPTKTKLVYQLEKNTYYGGDYNQHSLYVEGSKAMLYYHRGGAVMGADCRLELNPDGTVRPLQSSYYDTTAIGDKLFMVWRGPAPGLGGLRMAKDVDDEGVPLGSAGYWYYPLSNSAPFFSVYDNQLLVRAAKSLENAENERDLEVCQVYKVDVNTNKLTQVSHAPEDVVGAQLEGDNLYYLSKSQVYQISLKDGAETLLGTATGLSASINEQPFKVLGGKAYFTKEDGQLYTLGKETSLNPKAELLSMRRTGDNQEYLACTFKEDTAVPYRTLVFDRSGSVVFKSSDCSTGLEVEGSTLSFYNVTTQKVCSGKIK